VHLFEYGRILLVNHLAQIESRQTRKLLPA
jgi:hypothetical protein